MKEFEVHQRLLSGSYRVGTKDGCHLLLKNDSSFFWFIIVPEVDAGIEDLHQLEEDRYLEIMRFTRKVSGFISARYGTDKINVGCIGNIVRQMHIHVVGRFESDSAWPGVVWGGGGKTLYEEDVALEILKQAKICFSMM